MSDPETTQELQQKLAAAQNELEIWEHQGLNRRDGSEAQDRRFDDRGARLRMRVTELSRQLEAKNSNGA